MLYFIAGDCSFIHETSCYKLVLEKLSWFEAQEYCALRGGHLIEVFDVYVESSIERICHRKETAFL